MNLNCFPKVAIAVLNYNGKNYLQNCFNSINKIKYPRYEIILIDNNSQDGSIEYVKEKFPLAKIISFNKNLGFAKAYNNAISKIDAKYVLILNNDVIVDDSFLLPLVKNMVNDKDIAVVGSKILMMEEKERIAHAGGKITVIGSGIDCGLNMVNDIFNKKKYVGFCCGACFLVRKSAYLEVDGFDTDYFAYNEDVDLCWRLWLRGYKILYEPTSKIYHKCSGSWKKYNRKKIFFGQYSRLTNMIKNLECKTLVLSTMMSISYDILMIFKSMMEKKYKVCKAIISANIIVISDLKKILRKRKIIQRSRKINDSFLIQNGYIISLKDSIKEFVKIKI